MKQGSRYRHQKGFALVVSLLILVVLTLLGVSMFSNVGLQQRMAGNTREKNRAFNAAQTALQYGEWWLTQQPTAPLGNPCSGLTTTPTVCTQPLSSINANYPIQVPWTVGSPYSAPVSGQLNVSTTGGVNTYYSAPYLYIQYVGKNLGTGATVYRVTAWASGGNANAIAVVQSLYALDAGGGNNTPAQSLGG